MPVYNAEPFLDDAILSVMEQSFGDWELICVNDGSTDGSLSKLEAYASKDPRIRVFSKPNGGALNARNYEFDKLAANGFIVWTQTTC